MATYQSFSSAFFLGMRHATDPSHVIAVTTIVARQRRVGAAALIGVLWCIGRSARRSHASTGVWGGLGLYQILRPQVAGVVHGLAGSAAVALLVLPTIPDPLWGVAYLVLFGAGTIARMMLVTAASALPFTYTVGSFAALNRHPVLASAGASVGFGLFLVYRIGVVDGLFTSGPHWAPQ